MGPEVRTADPKDASADPQTESLTVNVTCEAAANCVYEPGPKSPVGTRSLQPLHT